MKTTYIVVDHYGSERENSTPLWVCFAPPDAATFKSVSHCETGDVAAHINMKHQRLASDDKMNKIF